MSENLFVMPSGEALPRCAYCQSRPILYRLKDYTSPTGDVFDAYFCKDCDGIEQAIQHHGGVYAKLFGEVVGDRHSMIGEPEQKAIDILYGADAIAWFNDYEPAPFNNSRQGDI